jgi:hypothetical protein
VTETNTTGEAPAEVAKIDLANLFSHLKLLPDYRELWATGGPIATIVLMKRELRVRCATEEDVARIAALTGKSVYMGFNALRETNPGQFLQIVEMALSDNDPKPDLAWLGRLPMNQHIRLVEVVSAFLWGGPV